MFQPSLEELGTPLHEVTFVVVDLETTGGSPHDDRITEVGAVKIRGGELVGELATLVDPGVAVPGAITALTGITDGMLDGRPPVETILPAFLEFARGATLVAHNARFDVGFLNANLVRLGYPRLDHPVVCTAALARRLLPDEVRNHRLGTLATHFRTRTDPTHRALADARATVEVFHSMLERAGTYGVMTLEDLLAFAKVANAPVFKARRGLAAHLPHAPGVYRFVGAAGEVLYVGTATDLKRRVQQYFGHDRRRRIADLVRETVRVDHDRAATPLEAQILELRQIREHRPRFNRRSTRPPARVWLKLTAETYPRLAITRTPKADGGTYLGPLPNRRTAAAVVDAIHDALPIRRCTQRMRADTRFSPCALAELGRCLAPCDGRVDPDGYAPAARAAAEVLCGDPGVVIPPLEARMAVLAGGGRFEEAADVRDRLAAIATATARQRQRVALEAAGFVAASRPLPGGRLRELVAIHAGRLVGTATCSPADVRATVEELAARPLPTGSPDPDELALLVAWLDRDGVRLHRATRGLALPVAGGRVLADLAGRLDGSRRRTGRAGSELADKRVRRQRRQ